MMDVLHMTEQAFDHGQLMELLIGKAPYHIPAPAFTPGYQPTDDVTLLSEGIYRLYLNRPEIKSALEAALLHMARTDAFRFYVAMAYLRAQVFREQRGLSPFRMESGILQEIGRCFALHAEAMKQGIVDVNGTYIPML